MADTQTILGPRKVTLLMLGLRAVCGLGGGVMGTMVLLISVLLGASIFSGFASEDGGGTLNPLVVFVFMAVTFLSSCLSNTISCLLIGLTDKGKYKSLFSTLYQVFAINLAILILMAPVYIIVSGVSVEMMAYVAALQILVSIIASSLILEILSDAKYALLGVYSTVFGLIFASAINFALYIMAGQNTSILLFAALPVIWMMLGLMNGLVGMGYRFVYDAYGIDFLSKYIKYGRDEEVGQEEEITRKDVLSVKKDVKGGEFF
ncbi:MAG: hypothetical protein ACD_65C00194G0002 [uncultured bacterium]|nr:MAG: hypothetical protein ACD_65C00194G0002 [uncultured bacterium]KKT02205.1 MAG: hypothetical protein UV80_C0005G0050 [Candidatus Peregrinibacteria bacterium GW2011_GWF2_43_17]KKT19676.1 MAG: hypothetical protein UW03_C0015G0052 [Candidatus Peregrinibacteria bacterium GW2011_GWA2_43_8]HAU40034.1 hypothetical protein [Candidatus Peregrinibacteria bacterium]